MLDIKRIRENPEFVKTALLKRMESVDLNEVLTLDLKRRELISEVEALKARKNEVNSEIPKLKALGQDVKSKFEEMKLVSAQVKALDGQLAEVDQKIHGILEALPNLPAEDVVAGGKENNQVVHEFGKKPIFDFPVCHHVDLATVLGLIDYTRGANLGGHGFWIYKGDGALLEWALLNYFIEEHRADGYELILPPHILNHECGYVSGQFPKFKEDVFYIQNEKEAIQFLLPTSETALINFHRGEILLEEDLPKKYFSYTPCDRKEAGSYRTQERGMIRGHQFNKVELFQFTRPEDSEAALQEMLEKSERLVKKLGLHYRLVKLAAQDCSASMGKTFDIEVWIPSMNEYKEVSSASNAYDYQARRGEIRLRRKETKKIEYLHSLNASGLATSRLFPAILEQFQRKDGSVVVPEVLRKWLHKDVLGPAAVQKGS
jgi:seryl-tRNA synthetase